MTEETKPMTEETKQEIEYAINVWAKKAAELENAGQDANDWKCLINGAEFVLIEFGYEIGRTCEELMVISR